MQELKEALKCLCLAAVLALLVQGALLVRDARTTVRAVPAKLDSVQSDLKNAEREQFEKLNDQITALRQAADSRLASIQSDANTHLGNLEKIADSRLGEATGAIEGVRSDISPTLHKTEALMGHSDALVSDIKDSTDDLYWDVKASVNSVAVGMRGTAETMEAVGKSAPAITASIEGIGKSSQSIAANVAKEVDSITKPKPWYGKILGPIYTAGRLVAAFL